MSAPALLCLPSRPAIGGMSSIFLMRRDLAPVFGHDHGEDENDEFLTETFGCAHCIVEVISFPIRNLIQ